MQLKTWGAALCALGLGAGVAGCANPKYIATSTGGADDIKFLFVDQYGEQGVIKCDRAEDGELSNCRRMRVVLQAQ